MKVKGTPEPTCKWYHDDVELVQSKSIQISLSGDLAQLVVQDVTSETAGEYRCEAMNRAGFTQCSANVILEGD